MENHKLVMPEHLNHFGYLFGGNLLKWVDEIAWIAASLEFPGRRFVTIALDKVEFRKSVREGSILRFEVNKTTQGRTSVQYQANVYRSELKKADEELIFSTHITFVCVDDNGNKTPLVI
ncbi:MAG: acyl-CoA thioesterase [Nitrospirae bacterium]|nr:acyl-CoA thioesterase [Nitrospirota bacterium]